MLMVTAPPPMAHNLPPQPGHQPTKPYGQWANADDPSDPLHQLPTLGSLDPNARRRLAWTEPRYEPEEPS